VTPEPVIDLMIAHAMIEDAHSILEPSAGSGAIADRIKAAYPSCNLDVFEVWHSLQEILKGKGHKLLGSNFMEFEAMPLWDRILMNPPFEDLADANHVIGAYHCLRDGGRLVAIMGPGAFFNTQRKAVAFRAWFEGVGGVVEDLPADSFKESGTSVNAKIIIVDKE